MNKIIGWLMWLGLGFANISFYFIIKETNAIELSIIFLLQLGFYTWFYYVFPRYKGDENEEV